MTHRSFSSAASDADGRNEILERGTLMGVPSGRSTSLFAIPAGEWIVRFQRPRTVPSNPTAYSARKLQVRDRWITIARYLLLPSYCAAAARRRELPCRWANAERQEKPYRRSAHRSQLGGSEHARGTRKNGPCSRSTPPSNAPASVDVESNSAKRSRAFDCTSNNSRPISSR